MAVLKEAQIKQKAERELKRQEAVKKKFEILADKKYKEAHAKELAEMKTDKRLPRIFDIEDFYNHFNPMSFFKDKDGNVLENEYNNFLKHEEEIKEKVDENQKDIYYENLMGEEVDYIQEDDSNGMMRNKKASGKVRENITSLNEVTAQFFNRFTPKYNFQICTCCGEAKRLRDFNVGWSPLYANRIDSTGMYHLPWCIECSKKMYDYLYTEKADHNPELAMEMLCCGTNIYWDAEIFNTARSSMEKQNRYKHIVGVYFQLLSRGVHGKTFWDSPILREGKQEVFISEKDKDITPYNWAKEDAQNRNTVLKMVGYDPFSYETEENKKILYRDLLSILDIGMENDLVKLQAAIQIVNSYFRIRLMNKKYSEMQFEIDTEDSKLTYKDLKELSGLRKTELDAITSFARDNGFSERFASAKAKGENTLTGIMNKMNTRKYEKAILNKYDIETSETIQQAADASFKSIFSQLSLGETDVWKICQDQLVELKKIRKENEKLKEKNRLLYCDISKARLEEKARENGIEVLDDD